MVLLEVVVDSPGAVRAAVAGGANRLEVCARLDVGGTTPDDAFVATALATGLPCFAMVRPRGGDFVHDVGELARMRADLARLAALGVHGFVLGVLDAHGEIAADELRAFVALAHPRPVTFHRAFDVPLARRTSSAGRAELVETLVRCGARRVLTSGGARDAHAGRHVLRDLVAFARGRIGILPGGGVRAHNAAEILAATGVDELHSSTPFEIDVGRA